MGWWADLLRLLAGAAADDAAAPPPKAPAEAASSAWAGVDLIGIGKPHRRFDKGANWAVTARGVEVDGHALRTPGEPATVRRVWEWFGPEIVAAAKEFGVPVELIVATIATESAGGKRLRAEAAMAERREPGFVSYTQTPHRVSIGPMQTLISTAREALGDASIGPEALREPRTSIRAGAAYIAKQRRATGFDPPVVGAAYNAGGVYEDASRANRWKMRCYPLGTGKHVERFASFFGDAMAVSSAEPWLAGDAPSFARALARR